MTTTIQDAQQGIPNPFLPTEIQPPEEEDRFKVFLIDTLQKIIDVINDKTIGIYLPTEVYNGQNWNYINPNNPDKFGYRVIFYMASIVTGTFAIPAIVPIQNNNANFLMTLCYGTASKPQTTPGSGDYFSFMNQGNPLITFTVSDNMLTITADASLAAYKGVFVFEYLKNS